MKYSNPILANVLLISIIAGSLYAAKMQEQSAKVITRVKRPVFSERDWDGVYFENLFEDGLVGPRPLKMKLAAPSEAPDTTDSSNVPAGRSFAWSNYIDRDAIENEVKSIQQQLEKRITTPSRFKSEYADARQSFASLSMLFAIIRQYDGEVRWKKEAAAAQAAFARAAANCRVGSQQAYQNAKLRKDDLTEMVRGGSFDSDEKVADELDWATAADRNAVMQRLEIAFDETLKPVSANKTEFIGQIERFLHEANIVAAYGQLLIQNGMDDAEEEEYARHARDMSTAAQRISLACKSRDYAAASAAVNQIGQSCSNCHDQWR